MVLLTCWPRCARFILFSLFLLGERVASFSYNGDVFVSSTRRSGFRMILYGANDYMNETESTDDRDAIASNVTHISGKLSLTGTFDSSERSSIFHKLRSVGSLTVFDNYENTGDILSSLMYVKGNLTITNSDVLSSRDDFLPNLRIIRGSFVYIDTSSSSTFSLRRSMRNAAANLEKVGQNFELHVSGVHERVESTAFPSLESVGGSFIISASKSLEVLEIGCFRNLWHVGKDFVISSESIRRISNFMSLQVVEGRLDLNATKNLRSLDGLQNLRRVGSGDIALGSSAVKNGEQFGKCGFIMLDEDKFRESNKTAYLIQHACFYDAYKWCQSMLLPNAYRCVNSIATKITTNRNLRKFSRILESSGEVLRLQALQKPITVFAPIDAAFLFLRSTLRERNGRNSSEYDELSFSATQATLRNVARAHLYSSTIDLSMLMNEVKLISELGEMEALEILLSQNGEINTYPHPGAHALAVRRQAPLFRSVSPIDKSVCESFSFHSVSTTNALYSKYCKDTTLSARVMLRPIDIVPYNEENEAVSTNASSSSASTMENMDTTSSSCLNRCGTCDNIELKTCCCDEACVQNGDCCGDFSYFCSIQYFLSREERVNNVVQRSSAFTTNRNFASGETERAALIIKSNVAQSHNGAKLILIDRVLHPIERYHSSQLLLYEVKQSEANEDFDGDYFPDVSSPSPPPPPPRPPPAPRRVTEFSWLYQTRPPPPSTSVDLKSPPPPESPPSSAPTTTIPPPPLTSSSSPPSPPQNTHIGSCQVQLPNICGLCDYTDESNVCCCDSMCVSTGDCCGDYTNLCV